jgi:hypothetical protein
MIQTAAHGAQPLMTRKPLLVVALGLEAIAAPPPAASALTVWAVGDGGVAGPKDDLVAARIAREGLHRLLYLGDVYDTGSAEEYASRFHRSFGRFKRLIRPTPGNHEWPNRAVGYDAYWRDLAPRSAAGHWYSFDLEGWHIVSLNSEEVSRPEQLAWLRSDLARHPGTCTISFLHRPRYSAGKHADDPDIEPLWSALAGRAVSVLAGHDHNYQRLRANRGLVQFVAGTGGRRLYPVDAG